MKSFVSESASKIDSFTGLFLNDKLKWDTIYCWYEEFPLKNI